MDYKGYRIEIEHDTDAVSPREWDNLGTMYCEHRRYNLGDRNADEPPENCAVKLPLYLYDHSGITMSTTPFSCRFDSGQVGWIYVTEKRLKNEGCTVEEAEEILKREVSTYDQYLTGEVYCYAVYDEEDNLLDSCSGMFGYDYCKESAMESVDYICSHCDQKGAGI